MAGFCDYLKKASVKCSPCVENKIGACHIKLGLQEYYPELFQIYDTIHIIRHDSRLSVDTDIEVKYKTKYPWGAQAGKGAEFELERAGKVLALFDFLEPKLPPGVWLKPLHTHYAPEVHDPEVVALHIHVHKALEDLDEAKVLVEKLAEVIRPSEIEAAIAPGR